MTTTLVKNIELIKLFVSASLNNDILAIEYLLVEDGVFEIEDKNLELIDASKRNFYCGIVISFKKQELMKLPMTNVLDVVLESKL
jgi:hypothetical protein